MRHRESIAVAVICDPQTQVASIAPFLDLAKISEQGAGEFDDGSTYPFIEIDLLTADKPLAASMLNRARSIDRSRQSYDAVVVPANCDIVDMGRPIAQGLRNWLRNHHSLGAMMVGIGFGVVMLIAAGLLHGATASCSPRYERRVRCNSPSTRISHTQSLSDNGQIITAAECNYSANTAVILAARLHSQGLAEQYRRAAGLPEHTIPPALPLPQRNNLDLFVAEARSLIVNRTHEPLTTDDLAAHFNMNKRTLIRRFERSTGMTPAKFIRAARIESAIVMLSRTQLSVEEIGCAIGYHDAASFRTAFREVTGYSPREFRMQPSQLLGLVARGESVLASVQALRKPCIEANNDPIGACGKLPQPEL